MGPFLIGVLVVTKALRVLLVAGCVLGTAGTAAFAQTPAKPPNARPRTENEYILFQLRSDDPAAVNAARERIKLLSEAGVPVSPNWLSALSEKGMDADVEAFALNGILNSAENTGAVSSLQKSRVVALLNQNKFDEALSAARAFYNVATLKETEAAVKLVARCLDEKNPDDSATLRRFKQQQVDWSTATTVPSDTGELGANVLSSIPLSAAPFASAATALTRREFQSLVAKGNLLLLAGKAKEAKQAFESAELAAEKPAESTTAVEGVARAIRAETGALGPANAYIVAQQKGP